MDSCQELEVLNWDLRSLDAKLVVEFPLGSPLHPRYRLRQLGTALTRYPKRMRAAGICPHVRKGNLLGGTLLQKQFILRVEEEDRECAVQKPLIDVGHEMALSTTVSIRQILRQGVCTYISSC